MISIDGTLPTVVYRCFGLTAGNRILWGRHIEAENAAGAFIAATTIMPNSTAAIEIWLEARKNLSTATTATAQGLIR
jgi:hypothetical protein